MMTLGWSVRRDVAFIVVTAGALSTGCQGEAARGWTGTERDSAGVRIVESAEGMGWPGGPPTIREDLRIGSMDGPGTAFGRIADVAVRADGTILVLDTQARTVLAFDPEGAPLDTVAGPGSGPGELGQGALALALVGDTLLVPDLALHRLNVLPPAGAPGSVPLDVMSGLPVRWEGDPSGRLLVQIRTLPIPGTGMTDRSERIVARGGSGTVQDTVLALPVGESFDVAGMRAAGGMPSFRAFASEPTWAVGPDGSLAYGLNGRYRIHVMDRDGALRTIVGRRAEPRPVEEADEAAFERLMRALIEAQGMPGDAADQLLATVAFASHYPAIGALMLGPEGTLWVQHVLTAPEYEAAGLPFDGQTTGGAAWDVFDADGRLHGTAELPFGFVPHAWRGAELYGVLRDELDVQYVVRLRVTGLPEV